MSDTKCRAIRSTGQCECAGFVKAANLDLGWEVCAVEGCGHTSAIHNGHKDRSKSLSRPAEAIPAANPASASKTLPRAAESVSGEFTPAQMRAWLVANNIPDVGERGRLKPEHKTLAIAGLSK